MSKHTSDKDRHDGEPKSQASELLNHPEYEELLVKLDEAEQKANQNWERVLRMQAEADNVQRRAERDLANAHKYALEKFISELLPIVDSLELSLTKVPKEMQASAASMIEGVDLTLKMFYTAMEKFGIQQVNPVHEAFNPEFQQAISTQVDGKVKPGTVLSVLQKGYTLNSRLIRPALVVVSKGQE